MSTRLAHILDLLHVATARYRRAARASAYPRRFACPSASRALYIGPWLCALTLDCQLGWYAFSTNWIRPTDGPTISRVG